MRLLTVKLQKALRLSFFDKYFGYILRIISTILLARLCTPFDLGVFSIAYIIIGFGHVIRDFGVAQYLIQEKDLNLHKIRSTFTLMVIIAWTLWSLIWIGRTWISAFYGVPELVPAIEILSWVFVLAPFGTVALALLRRSMNFKVLTKINIFSYCVLHSTTLILAYFSLGYRALLYGQLAGVIATLLAIFYYCKLQGWYQFNIREFKSVLSFGFPICLAGIVENANDAINEIIVGRAFSMQAVGFYGRAQGLLNIFRIGVTSAVWPVVLPYFSLKNRQGGLILPDYLKAIEVYTIFAWPFFIAIAIFAKPLVLLLLGQPWYDVIPLIQVLSFAFIIQAIFPFFNAVFISQGVVHFNLLLMTILCLLKIVIVLVAARFGLQAVAHSMIVYESLAFICIYMALRFCFGLKMFNLLTHLNKSFTVLCFVGLFFFTWHQVCMHYLWAFWVECILALLLGVSFWFILLRGFNHPLYPILCDGLKRLRYT